MSSLKKGLRFSWYSKFLTNYCPKIKGFTKWFTSLQKGLRKCTREVYEMNKRKLAEELGVSRVTLNKRLEKFGQSRVKVDETNYNQLLALLKSEITKENVVLSTSSNFSYKDGDSNEHKQYNDLVDMYEYNFSMVQQLKERMVKDDPAKLITYAEWISKHEKQMCKIIEIMNKIKLPKPKKKSNAELMKEAMSK